MTTADALALLPPGDTVQALRFVGDRVIVANWHRDTIECLLLSFPCEEPGPDALAAGYGLAVLLGGERPLFVATKESTQ